MGVEIKGMDSLRRKLKATPKILEDAMWDATFEITELIKQATELRIASSVKYSSGELLGSFKNEVVINAQGKIVGRIWSDKEQAMYREFGTGPVGQASQKDLPEGITPVYSTSAWFIPVDEVEIDLEAIYGIPRITIQGKGFFLTRGQPARPALYPSLKEIVEQAPDIYKEHVQKRLKELK
ncbi:HK97 gp10 family phage protein [Enterococcus sp. SMC-9]|uniref:HK97 gp10 family phage protein n=1 Tax=Enterococcus sp. SMC-9 TaxID=2862343 RepID=UPI001E395E22|nr:HK97 gp10 family phage protein [Enterococcus sp. SMC-9]MCD1023468.1 HK97 gp10 family phage protein [Enterococcus sp. SMC-9]